MINKHMLLSDDPKVRNLVYITNGISGVPFGPMYYDGKLGKFAVIF
mgnify:CR=1 FL=1